jgi:hypothetical protein
MKHKILKLFLTTGLIAIGSTLTIKLIDESLSTLKNRIKIQKERKELLEKSASEFGNWYPCVNIEWKRGFYHEPTDEFLGDRPELYIRMSYGREGIKIKYNYDLCGDGYLEHDPIKLGFKRSPKGEDIKVINKNLIEVSGISPQPLRFTREHHSRTIPNRRDNGQLYWERKDRYPRPLEALLTQAGFNIEYEK